MINGSTFRGLQTGVSLAGITREITIENDVFESCETAILLKGHDRAGCNSVSVSSCNMVNNVNHVRLIMSSFSAPEHHVHLTFENSIVVCGGDAVIFDGSQSGELFTWNVRNNLFRNVTGRVLRLRGAGSVTSNVITDNSLIDGVIVDVEIRTTNRCVTIERNRFERNTASIVLSFCSSCDSGFLLGNDFITNYITNSVITCIHPSLSSTTQTFLNNTLVNNTVNNVVISYSAALLMTWTSKLCAHLNTFANPGLTYEVANEQPTLNSSTRLNFLDNDWGTEDTDLINRRILDGRDMGWNPLIRWSKVSSSKWVFDASKPLQGRLEKSVTLRRRSAPYVVSGNLLVPVGITLTLEPGVTLSLVPSASLFVEGTIVAKGSPNDFIHFQRRNSVNGLLPLRLINDHNGYRQLQAFIDGEWRSFCLSGWTSDNTDVACRQLGFIGGMCIHINYDYFNPFIVSHFYNGVRVYVCFCMCARANSYARVRCVHVCVRACACAFACMCVK